MPQLLGLSAPILVVGAGVTFVIQQAVNADLRTTAD